MTVNDIGDVQVAHLEKGIRAPQNDTPNLDSYRMPVEKKPVPHSEAPSHIAATIEKILPRVDVNRDGSMSQEEMQNALKGNKLDAKEKNQLRIIKGAQHLIDRDNHPGISLQDARSFDIKVNQYVSEVQLADKLVPDHSNFAGVLLKHSKLIDANKDGRISDRELMALSKSLQKSQEKKPSEEVKKDIAALEWGIANYGKFALLTGRPGGGETTVNYVMSSLLSELDKKSQVEQWKRLSPKDRSTAQAYFDYLAKVTDDARK